MFNVLGDCKGETMVNLKNLDKDLYETYKDVSKQAVRLQNTIKALVDHVEGINANWKDTTTNSVIVGSETLNALTFIYTSELKMFNHLTAHFTELWCDASFPEEDLNAVIEQCKEGDLW
jgi:hypothetical protein